MQQIGRRGFLMATGAAGLLATGLGAPRMARAASADIGIASPDPIYCVSYVAFKNGYFKDAGLEANYIDTQSGPRGKQMLAAGQVFATTSGTNDAGLGAGFTAIAGWDAATGWGTPDYALLKAAL